MFSESNCVGAGTFGLLLVTSFENRFVGCALVWFGWLLLATNLYLFWSCAWLEKLWGWYLFCCCGCWYPWPWFDYNKMDFFSNFKNKITSWMFIIAIVAKSTASLQEKFTNYHSLSLILFILFLFKFFYYN